MKKVVLGFLLFSQLLFSEARSYNLLYGQFPGYAGSYSVNFEHLFLSKIGYGRISVSGGCSIASGTFVNVPLALRLVWFEQHQLFVGVGVMPEWFTSKEHHDFQCLTIGDAGYRYLFKNGLLLGLNYTPVVEYRVPGYYHGMGMTLGWRLP